MDSHLWHRALADDNLDTGLSEILNVFFESLFFTGCVIFQLLGIGEKDGTFCFTLIHFDICVENGNLGVGNVVNGRLRLSQANHASDNFGIVDTTSQYFLHSDIVDV